MTKYSGWRLYWSAESPEVGILYEATYTDSLPCASATPPCMRQRGRGNNLNSTMPTSPGRPQSGGIRHVSLWRCVHCTKHSPHKQSRAPQCWDSKTTKENARCFTVVLGHYRILVYKISACEVSIIWQNRTEVFKIRCKIAESRTGKPAIVTQKIQLDCFPVHDTTPLGKHICAQPFTMWNRHIFIRFGRSRKYFNGTKAMQINKIWKWS